ncbi:MAG: (2Fe-2S)-binding protein [Chloroflexi bacterium]|nr:(2Fe-2S)-binding protein [Chloroflexota bacterium]
MAIIITIDGRQVAFDTGQSIIAAAEAAGIDIPHLCWHERLSPAASCRVCLVRVDGRLAAACATTAAPDQVIEVQTLELQELRRDLLRMLFVEGNHFCPVCEASGGCKLQALAYQCDVLDVGFRQQFPRRELDASHPEVLLERDRCILCGLCVRASHELDKKDVFELAGRGAHTHLIVNSPSGRLGDSVLTKDDAAAAICPVGALIRRGNAFATPIGQRLHDRAEAAT